MVFVGNTPRFFSHTAMHCLFQLQCFCTEFRKNLSKWLPFICRYYQLLLCWLFGSKDDTWLLQDTIVTSWFCGYQRIYMSKSTEKVFSCIFITFPLSFEFYHYIFDAISLDVRCTKGWSSNHSSRTKPFIHTKTHLTFFSSLIIFFSHRSSWWGISFFAWFFYWCSFKTYSRWLTLIHLSVAPSLSVLPHIPPTSFDQRLTVASITWSIETLNEVFPSKILWNLLLAWICLPLHYRSPRGTLHVHIQPGLKFIPECI